MGDHIVSLDPWVNQRQPIHIIHLPAGLYLCCTVHLYSNLVCAQAQVLLTSIFPIKNIFIQCLASSHWPTWYAVTRNLSGKVLSNFRWVRALKDSPTPVFSWWAVRGFHQDYDRSSLCGWLSLILLDHPGRNDVTLRSQESTTITTFKFLPFQLSSTVPSKVKS